MPDFEMCTADCTKSKKCERHKNSGTVPSYYQSYGINGYEFVDMKWREIPNFDGSKCVFFIKNNNK